MLDLRKYKGRKLSSFYEYLLEDDVFDIALYIMVYTKFRNKVRNLTCSPWYKSYQVLSEDVTDSKILKLGFFRIEKKMLY